MANAPHGGQLKDLVARDAHLREELIDESRGLADIYLNEVSIESALPVMPYMSLTSSAILVHVCYLSRGNYVTWSSFATVDSLLSRVS